VLALLLVLALAVAPEPHLNVPRAAHTATPLADGRVLLVGGCSADSCELDERGATAELFDPLKGTFSKAAALAGPRVGHGAVRLRDGRVLVAGGWVPQGLTPTAAVYEPRFDRWRSTGSLRTARGGVQLIRLADGRVLAAGGSGDRGPLRSAELYDPRTGRWTATGSLATARIAHATVQLAGGRVLVLGGSRQGSVLASVEAYDPRTGRWSPAGRLAVARHKHAAVGLRAGGVLVVGGSNALDGHGRHASVELYDLRRRSSRVVATMKEPRFKLPDAVVRLGDGRVLIAGGGRTLEAYDPRTRRLAVVGRAGAALSFATATRLPDGRVLVAGGYDDRIAVTDGALVFRP
jgi:hypothetical protein